MSWWVAVIVLIVVTLIVLELWSLHNKLNFIVITQTMLMEDAGLLPEDGDAGANILL